MEDFVIDELLSDISVLAERINQSDEALAYIRANHEMKHDEVAQRLIRQFQTIKDEYEEAQRFGIFHPNYHESKEKAKRFQKKLEQHPTIASFYKAEKALDQLLHQVSLTIAHSVSETIKVPSNEIQPRSKRKSCQS